MKYFIVLVCLLAMGRPTAAEEPCLLVLDTELSMARYHKYSLESAEKYGFLQQLDKRYLAIHERS